MKLEELIKDLEEAQYSATGGEWYAKAGRVFRREPTVCIGEFCILNADPIAVRHNTAGEVLDRLKSLAHVLECQETSGLLDAYIWMVDVKNMEESRAEKAEARLAHHECVEHETPLFGECDRHNPDREDWHVVL